MIKRGADFEKAVYAFAKALDPLAEVLFDQRVPDRDTNTLRQCDVWINAKFGGHWPLSILVSCKDHTRKLDIGDIGTFCSEIHSTRASCGVIYSRAGFTQPALEKAKANNVVCCRLYQNEPADIPGSIIFEQFACTPRVALTLLTDPNEIQLKTWNDIFDLRVENVTLLDFIVAEYANGERQSIEEGSRIISFPPDWQKTLVFAIDEEGQELRLQMFGQWKWYRAQIEATLLDGSYCLSDGSFKGTLTGPTIDTQSGHPGEGWTEITDRNINLPVNRMLAVLYQGNIKDGLRKELGPKELGQMLAPYQ